MVDNLGNGPRTPFGLTTLPNAPTPPDVEATLKEVMDAGIRAGGYMLERDVWFNALRAALRREAALRVALVAWLAEIEELPGAKNWFGPYTSATDKLIKLARECRGPVPGGPRTEAE